MSDSVRPHRRQPTRLPHPWDSPGKNTGVGCHLGCHFLLQECTLSPGKCWFFAQAMLILLKFSPTNLSIHWWILTRSSLFFYFIYFNWRLTTLQYCSGSCHTLAWIGHGCTGVPYPEPPLPPPSPSHPSGSSQCTSPEQPVSCIKPGLAICFTYGNTHMLFYTYTSIHINAMLSNHPTLAFSHRVQETVLYICVSFAALHIESSLLMDLICNIHYCSICLVAILSCPLSFYIYWLEFYCVLIHFELPC